MIRARVGGANGVAECRPMPCSMVSPPEGQGGPAEKKYHSESGLNQRDRVRGEFVRVYTHRKPVKFFYWRGFGLLRV